MSDVLAARLLLDLALIVAVAGVAGPAARRLGQPPVLGEIVAGVLLGPTLFGGALTRVLFPADVLPYLTLLANLGVVLFMFAIGLELDTGRLRGSGRVTTATAIGSAALPFGLGCLLALYLVGHHRTPSRLGSVLFLGVALSVTAFPVLARIITDQKMGDTRIGSLALSTAAVCDVAAWTALGVVQAVFGQSGRSHWWVLLAVPYALVMFLLVRPLLRRFLLDGDGAGRLTAGRYAVMLIGMLGSAALTQLVGLHFIFGAFLFGLVMPRQAGGALRRDVLHRSQAGITLLLPVYFVVAGLGVNLAHLGPAGLLELIPVVLVAIVGKFAGCYGGARSQGLGNHPALVLAALMNTRGLTELIVLGVGRQLGLLDGNLYSIMVVMAVVTTAMSGPLLHRLRGRELAGRTTDLAFTPLDREPSTPAHIGSRGERI